MWVWIVALVIMALAAAGTVSAITAAGERRRQYAAAVRLWRETLPGQRVAVLDDRSSDTEPSAPAWYLAGCAHLQAYQTKSAARAFGIAHHADCNLETAALLAFACLKAAEGEDSDIVGQIVTTWHEMKCPDLLRHRQDRCLLECLEATADAAPNLSPLGRLAWAVVGPALRPQVLQSLPARAPETHALH